MSERRRYPRIKDRRKVWLTLSSGQRVCVWSHDISLGGIQVLFASSADVGDRFRLEFSISDVSGERMHAIRCLAEVAHVIFDSRSSQFRIGFRFVEFNGEDAALFRDYLDRRVRVHYQR